MKTYWATFMLRLKLEMQYRAAALGGLVTQLFFGLIYVFLYHALYGKDASITVLAATSTYVWLQQACFRMVLSDDSELTATILRGDIAYQLIRPVDQYTYWYARALAQKLAGTLLRAAPMLLIALLLPYGYGLALPAGLPAFLLFVLSLAMGFLTMSAVSAISSGIIIRTLDNRGVTAVLQLITLFLCGNIIPLTLFPDSWQRFLAFSPFSQILDTPIRLYTGEYPLSAAPQMLTLQLGWIVMLVLLGRWIWARNLRRVIVQGG